MKKKTKAMRQGVPVRWDGLSKALEAKNNSAALDAREKMIERHKGAMSLYPFAEVKEPVTPEDAYQYMTRGATANEARKRMIERRQKMRKDSYFPGGYKQTGESGEARDAMVEKMTTEPNHKPESVHEIISMFYDGRLTREQAYDLYLELNDTSEVTEEEMQQILLGRADSKDARERMLRRKGYSTR